MTENYKFCRQASKQYERWLEEAGDDPRIVASLHIAAEWRTPYHLAPGKESAPDPKITYGETTHAYINGLSEVDSLFPNTPYFLSEIQIDKP